MNRLKELRISRHLTVRDLGNMVGIANSALSSIENGKRKMGLNVAIILADYFGVSVDYLMSRSKSKVPCAEELIATREPLKQVSIGDIFIGQTTRHMQVYYPSSKMADKNGFVPIHRLVMAKHLGRDLTSEEVVHHIDCNPGNNQLSNLMLFPNNAEHRKFHRGVHYRQSAVAIACIDDLVDELVKR